MYIEKEFTINGHETTVHRILRTEISDKAYVTLASYADANSASGAILFCGTYEIPFTSISGDNIVESIYNWLVSEAGPQAGGTIHADEDVLVHAKKVALASIATNRDLNIAGGAITALGQVDTDEVSLRNILGSCQIAGMLKAMSQPFSIGWKYSDNVVRTLDADAMILMGMTVMQHVSACYTVSWSLKDAVTAATTVEEVEAIQIVGAWNVIPTSPHHVSEE